MEKVEEAEEEEVVEEAEEVEEATAEARGPMASPVALRGSVRARPAARRLAPPAPWPSLAPRGGPWRTLARAALHAPRGVGRGRR